MLSTPVVGLGGMTLTPDFADQSGQTVWRVDVGLPVGATVDRKRAPPPPPVASSAIRIGVVDHGDLMPVLTQCLAPPGRRWNRLHPATPAGKPALPLRITWWPPSPHCAVPCAFVVAPGTATRVVCSAKAAPSGSAAKNAQVAAGEAMRAAVQRSLSTTVVLVRSPCTQEDLALLDELHRRAEHASSVGIRRQSLVVCHVYDEEPVRAGWWPATVEAARSLVCAISAGTALSTIFGLRLGVALGFCSLDHVAMVPQSAPDPPVNAATAAWDAHVAHDVAAIAARYSMQFRGPRHLAWSAPHRRTTVQHMWCNAACDADPQWEALRDILRCESVAADDPVAAVDAVKPLRPDASCANARAAAGLSRRLSPQPHSVTGTILTQLCAELDALRWRRETSETGQRRLLAIRRDATPAATRTLAAASTVQVPSDVATPAPDHWCSYSRDADVVVECQLPGLVGWSAACRRSIVDNIHLERADERRTECVVVRVRPVGVCVARGGREEVLSLAHTGLPLPAGCTLRSDAAPDVQVEYDVGVLRLHISNVAVGMGRR